MWPVSPLLKVSKVRDLLKCYFKAEESVFLFSMQQIFFCSVHSEYIKKLKEELFVQNRVSLQESFLLQTWLHSLFVRDPLRFNLETRNIGHCW